MRLNICCGRQVIDGWTNIDVKASPRAPRPPEMLAMAGEIPLPDGCADEIMVIHGWEHFYLWECEVIITEWRRLLRDGGRLILEMPDLLKCCRNVLNNFHMPGKDPNQHTMWGLYGDPRTEDPYMMHRWGWTPKSLREFLKAHGFLNITDAEPKWHPAGRIARDMRMEATK